MSAVILSNFFWGYISDFRGNKVVLQLSAFFCLLAPLSVIAARFLTPWLLLFGFFVTGFCLTGRRIGNTNFLLDIAPVLNRPTYIGLRGTLNFPMAIFPLLGG
ncbi:MAG: hypothetical protein J7J25_01625 [Candidatus Omnitrophica bacterium]|nr:hypothetical protein [Candidatus Omnitrophota bacterium]